MQDIFIQESILTEEYFPDIERKPANKKEERSVPGSRVSISQISTLGNLYKEYGKEDNKYELGELKYENREEVLSNVEKTIYGTQMHYFQYLTQLISKTYLSKRVPTYEDLITTFPQKDIEYYKGMMKLVEISSLNPQDDVLDSSQTLWNEWRMNGQDFTPSKHKNYFIEPSIIKKIWEDGVIPFSDIEVFKKSFRQLDIKGIDPRGIHIMNETFMLLNMYFNDSNLQISSSIDEMRIPRDFPNSPIEIIDYKTGNQFKKPGFNEKVQIFLMMSSILVNVVDRVGSIKYGGSTQDLLKGNMNVPFPHFEGKKASKQFVGSIFAFDLLESIDLYSKYLQFSYVNPVTKEKLLLSSKDIGIDTKKGMERMLEYLNRMNSFYLGNKEVLKGRISNAKAPYALPVFPIKGFDMESGYSKGVQIPWV